MIKAVLIVIGFIAFGLFMLYKGYEIGLENGKIEAVERLIKGLTPIKEDDKNEEV